jgi:uncharacterized iron-regulated membrane protein
MDMDMRFYRRWHRWISTFAAIFLAWAAITGVIVAFTEFFGADEAERERLRDTTSAVKLDAADPAVVTSLSLALTSAMAKAPGAPVDKIELKLKGDKPVVNIFLGKPGGGEDRTLRFDGKTGAFLAEESYEDKPLIYRLHSGEAFGDGGLVVAMGWGLALALMSITGFLMYWHMMRRHKVPGWRKYIW